MKKNQYFRGNSSFKIFDYNYKLIYLYLELNSISISNIDIILAKQY